MKLTSQMALTTMNPEVFYGLRQPSTTLSMWSARARVDPTLGEKLLCAIGQNGLFIKRSDITTLANSVEYTLVWGHIIRNVGQQNLLGYYERYSSLLATEGLLVLVLLLACALAGVT